MIEITGYWEDNGNKSDFKTLNVKIKKKRLEKLRTDLSKATGNTIIFYKIEKP
jgi:hypothetical protein